MKKNFIVNNILFNKEVIVLEKEKLDEIKNRSHQKMREQYRAMTMGDMQSAAVGMDFLLEEIENSGLKIVEKEG
jgi:hypothetical protein|tara:strand:- start:1193 stop:1414 length:222 start_codon:yes stop_codon:yes gene_type:complete